MGSSFVLEKSDALSSAAVLAVGLVAAVPALADKNAPEPDLDPPAVVEPIIDQTKVDQGEDAPDSAPPIVTPPELAAPLADDPDDATVEKNSLSKGGREDETGSGPQAPTATPADIIVPDPATKPDSEPSATCPADVVWLRGDFGKARFTVDVADTRSLRAQGLMNVPHMPASRGMLFVYEYPQEVAFWMKNTLIPLDIIFADERGVVSNIQANAIPGDVTALPGKGLVQYVLEINGGMASDMGISPGTQIQHPAIFSPIWPCE